MKHYQYQACIKLSENLKDSMEQVCETYNISKSDYMRRSISRSVQSDLKNTNNSENKYVFL